MRIAVDTSFLLLNRASGMKTYTRDLLCALLESHADTEYLCWYNVFRKTDSALPDWPGPTRNVVCRLPRRVLEAGWRTLAFPPIECFTGSIDVFHSVHLQVPPVRRARTVLTVHDLREFRLPHLFPHLQAMRPWRKRMAASADHIITISESTRQDIVEFFELPPEQVSVAYNGLTSRYLGPGLPPETVARIQKKYGLEGIPYVLTASSMDPRKDVVTAVKAVRILQSRGWKGLLVTVGPLLDARVVSGDGMRALGFVDDNDLQGLMTGAQVFLFPSLYEGFGLPVLEALASGTPVVACDTSAIPEVAGEAALLVPPGDAEAMAEATGMLLSDTTRRQQLIETGRTQAARFTWRAHGEKVHQIYAKLAAS